MSQGRSRLQRPQRPPGICFLDEIRGFPTEARKILESQYGIDTAEAFYARAVKNPEGLGKALNASKVELDGLTTIVEGHLSKEFIERCRGPAAKHPRGLIIEDDQQ
jgi:hypothetical protein